MAKQAEQAQGKKRKVYNARIQQGSRKQRREFGRKEWARQPRDRRAENEERNAERKREQEEAVEDGEDEESRSLKKQKLENGGSRPAYFQTTFTEEEIAAEERRPKHKVAVMIGYSGTGYRGMQINRTEKTIEGDLFAAFVKAGAISKANANDPKKSNLVRCARTDKGVHAAGNVISLKLITEDPDIVAKINEHLSPQIRIWGIQRTTGSFSCYQACDSRWYEYLIPSHAFLPPHPRSYLGKKLYELAEEAGDLEGYKDRQEEVSTFWSETEEKYIKPILDTLDDWTRKVVLKRLHEDSDELLDAEVGTDVVSDNNAAHDALAPEQVAEGVEAPEVHTASDQTHAAKDSNGTPSRIDSAVDLSSPAAEEYPPGPPPNPPTDHPTSHSDRPTTHILRRKKVESALKALRAAITTAKRAYRLPPRRLSRLTALLASYTGTHPFHNYTVSVSPHAPAAKRHIRSFTLAPPLTISGTEWLSLRVHGQSFMMHQIRKMVGMLALVVRCGAPASRVEESFGAAPLAIPKAPGCGLLLERPVFETYNEGAAEKFGRDRIDFGRYEAEMEAFKREEIYRRIWREEEDGSAFHVFFAQVDAGGDGQFLWLSSVGRDAVKRAESKAGGKAKAPVESEDEDEAEGGGG